MNLQASPRGKSLIEQFENCAQAIGNGQFRAYPDPYSPMGLGQYPIDGPDVTKGHPWTIGFGETGPDVTRGVVWTLAKCEARFDARIATVVAGVNYLLHGHPTTQNQFDALVSFAYNCGLDIDADKLAEGLGDSTLLRLHLAGDYAGAAKEFPKWDKSAGRVSNGLLRRRKAEAALYLTP